MHTADAAKATEGEVGVWGSMAGGMWGGVEVGAQGGAQARLPARWVQGCSAQLVECCACYCCEGWMRLCWAAMLCLLCHSSQLTSSRHPADWQREVGGPPCCCFCPAAEHCF